MRHSGRHSAHTPPPLLPEEMTHYAVSGRNLERNACLSGGLLLKVRGGYFRCLLL